MILNSKTILTLAVSMSAANHLAKASPFEPVSRLEEVSPGLSYDVQQPAVEDPELFAGKRVAILAAHGVQESELRFPYEYLTGRGAIVHIVSPDWLIDRIVLVRYLKPTQWVKVDSSFKEAEKTNYDMLILTGGAWNSTVVRTDSSALSLIRNHYSSGKPIAAICSATQILINAELTDGHNLTGTSSIKLDLENAGANYVDQPVVLDRGIITSRNPYDLVPFVNAIRDELLND